MNAKQYSFSFLIWTGEVYLVYYRISITKDLVGFWYRYSSSDNDWRKGKSIVDIHRCFRLFFQKNPLLDFYIEKTIISSNNAFQLIKINNINKFLGK